MENNLDEIDLNHLLELVQDKLDFLKSQEVLDECNTIPVLQDLESKILDLLNG